MADESVKQLLEAEQKAQEIVSKARKERTKLLKRAEEEAQHEIAAYKEQRQTKFETHADSFKSATDERSQGLAAKTEAEIAIIGSQIAANKEKVLDMLVKPVIEVKLE